MSRLRDGLHRGLWLASLLALASAAEPPLEEALDVVPAPGRATSGLEDGGAIGEAPSAARVAAWRSAARQPGVVPAVFVLRAALREVSARREAGRSGNGEARSRVIEIVWNAPGTAD